MTPTARPRVHTEPQTRTVAPTPTRTWRSATYYLANLIREES